MPRHSTWDDDEDDDRDWSAGEFHDESIDADDDTEPTYPCPSCRALVYEEAHACPYCGEYLAFDDPHHGSGRPWWVWVGAIAALASILGWVLLMVLGLLG